ncbi:MAG TPA: Type 1 glutamine amidotransferase-like domain-containing protein [Candidatus Saccharimonadales bacterium]|nr:Type 1 glutamine amidotransferase-like domain-containing protein [Candidatus Saccharimonadales bacterium]
MKLYLSSYKLGTQPEAFTGLFGENKRTAIIMNAQDLVLPERRAMRLQEERTELSNLDLQPEELDLRTYFGRPEAFAATVKQYGGLWIRGGNVFVLRRAMKQCGFDEAVIPLVRDNQLVYAGFSAGSCAAGPDLRGLELVDDADSVPDGYDTAQVWSCLNLIPYSIAPHYRSPHPESEAIETVVAYFEANAIPYKTLHDGQAIVIDGDDERIVG